MADDPTSQIWLTSALVESDVQEALTLCCSLKRVLTTRKVGVILSKKLPEVMVKTLYQGFDYLFYLEENWNTAELNEQDFVKLFPLTMKPFEICVFLSPSMLAINNCDKVFDDCRSLRHSVLFLTKASGMDVFAMRPCWKVFEGLMKGLLETSGTEMEKYIRKSAWTNNYICDGLSDTYNCLLSAQGFPQLRGENGALLVNTRDLRLDMNTEELGLFAKVSLVD
ncbi:unnamed protein product [Orchesella dallaii]|uniref:Uncharacterized protein n=1 Tax=Orchesella dallaii TaxID=48710 RepID=A0ABP1RYR7_9HEXA